MNGANRKFWLIFMTPILVFTVFISLLKWVLVPWASQYALDSAKTWSQKEGPVSISAARAEVSFFRPKVDLYDIEIKARGELKNNFDNLKIDQITFELDIFQIFTGRLQVADAILKNPTVRLNIDSWLVEKGKPEELPIKEFLKLVSQVPIQRFWLENINLHIESHKFKSTVQLQNSYLNISLSPQKINLKAELNQIKISWQNTEPLQFSLVSQLTLNKETLRISGTEIKMGSSNFKIDGELESISKILLGPQGQISTGLQVDLQQVEQILKTYLPRQKKIPLEGLVNASADLTLKGFQNIQGQLQIKTTAVKVDNFDLGDSVIRGTYKNQELYLEEVAANHPAAQVQLAKTTFLLHAPWSFESSIKVEKLDLQKLLQSIKLKNVPVELKVQGKSQCKGQIENFHVTCQTEMTATDMVVYSEDRKRANAIVDVLQAGAIGEVTVDTEKVAYKSQVFLGSDQGQSEGVVDFRKGFKIAFHSPSVNFKNIKNLSGLKFEGVTPVEGVTEGDSIAATLKMKLRPANFVFENYQLGTIEGDLSYQRGHLLLQKLAGQIDQTIYAGDIDIDLAHSSIEGVLQLPKADLKDISWVFQKIYTLPIDVSGPGSADVTFHGPLSFWNMSYELNSQFKNGKISADSFNDLTAHIVSNKGHVNFDKVLLTKAGSTVTAHGGIGPDKIADLQMRAQNLRLEESETVTHFSQFVYGVLNLTASLKGSILNPDFELSGTLNENILADQEVSNSFFSLSTNPKQTVLSGTLFGNRIQAEVTWPRENRSQNLKIRAKTTDWAYAPLLALLGNGQIQSEYETSITSDVDLISPTGDWKKLSGQIKIPKFLLKRGSLYLRNSDPLLVDWDSGRLNIKNLELSGPQNNISVRGGPFTFQNFDVSLNGKVELKTFQLFLPFLEDIGGPLEGQATLTGSWDHPKILGNAKLDSNFFKIKGFPHPFEKISADVTFSHTKILIPQFHGILAGGNLEGSGDIQINGIRDIPVNISATAEGLNLAVPEKIRTSGNAEMTLTGKWFPFVLAGTYHVQSGLFEKEFEEFAVKGQVVQQSRYLPQVLKEEVFEPLILDIQLDLERNMLVKNSMMEGIITGQLQVKGPPQNPILMGKIEADKNAKITFKDKIFEVQTAQITFNNPAENNPDIFLSARTRVDQYDISLIVQGPSKNYALRLSSTPPLAENDIFSLLALGITSTRLEQNVQSAEQAKQTATEVFGSVLTQTVGRGFQNTTGFNIQVSNSYDSTKNISVPKLTFSRQLGPKTSVQLSRLISGGGDTNDVKLQYQLDQNLSAIGSFESRTNQDPTADKTLSKDQQSIFGLDLEFRRDFK